MPPLVSSAALTPHFSASCQGCCSQQEQMSLPFEVPCRQHRLISRLRSGAQSQPAIPFQTH